MNSPHYYGNHIAHVNFCKIPGYSVLINNPHNTQDTWSIPQAIREISEFINGNIGPDQINLQVFLLILKIL